MTGHDVLSVDSIFSSQKRAIQILNTMVMAHVRMNVSVPDLHPPIDVRIMIVDLLVPTILETHIIIAMMRVITTNLEIILLTLVHPYQLLLITMTRVLVTTHALLMPALLNHFFDLAHPHPMPSCAPFALASMQTSNSAALRPYRMVVQPDVSAQAMVLSSTSKENLSASIGTDQQVANDPIPVMCSVTASGKRLVGGNELQPTLNLSTLYTITNVLNSGVSSTIEALCRLDNQVYYSH
ncbi:uncharacterized protein ARMOST_13591 [Armillaria ostoyae]|uniref:Uncharacterized protein n=1 Tax=Armillaria ostoyae TaxID=47428 RepID=A0A284RN70_ARMOS|nr:uncharacterized protein ARMOST_13591 [Armillaria ostoyae]